MPSIFDEIDAIEAQQTATTARKPSVFDEIDAIEVEQSEQPGAFGGQIATFRRGVKQLQQAGNVGAAFTRAGQATGNRLELEYLDRALAGEDFSAVDPATLSDQERTALDLTNKAIANLASGEQELRAGGFNDEQIATWRNDLIRRRVDTLTNRAVSAEQALPRSLGRIAELQQQIGAIRESPDVEAYRQARAQGDTMGALKVAATNPIEIPLNIAIGSLPVAAPAIVGGTVGGLAGGPLGSAAGVAAGSFAIETTTSILDAIQQAGVDVRDAAQLEAAFSDQSIMDDARDRAVRRGVPVAAFDALSAGMAGRFLVAAKRGGVSMVRAGAKEVGAQALAGAAGEAGAQVTTGEFDPLAIAEEAVGELVPGVREIAQNYIGEMRGKRDALVQTQFAAQQAQQTAQVAGQVVDQASQQVAQSQQTLQTTKAGDAATISSALENPEAATLDDMEAKQRELAEQAKESQATTQEASQTLQQSTATLQQASAVEQQANQQLQQLGASLEQILSQPITPMGGIPATQQPATQQEAQTEQAVQGEPVLLEAQPAQVGPVSLAEVAPTENLQNAGQIGAITQAAGPQEGLVGGEGGRVRLRDDAQNRMEAIPGEAVLNAGQAAPTLQPIEAQQSAPALTSAPGATLTPAEPLVAPVSMESRLLNRQVGELPKGTEVSLTGERKVMRFETLVEVQNPDGSRQFIPAEWLKKSGTKTETLSAFIKRVGREEVQRLLGDWQNGAELSADGRSIVAVADPRNQKGRSRVSTREFMDWVAAQESPQSVAATAPAILTPAEPQMAPESIAAPSVGLPAGELPFTPGPEAQAILEGVAGPDELANNERRDAPLDPDAIGGANYPLAKASKKRAKRGLIVGSKSEQWADKTITDATKEGKLYSGLDPKLSFAYAVKGAALIEQGIRDFAAWSAEMTKRYAGLTADNLKELFARATEMDRQVKAGEQIVVPPEVRGELVSTEGDAAIEAEAARQNNQPPPTPDPESIEQAEGEGIQSALADPSTPAKTREIITTVLGQDFTVDGRRQQNAGEMQRSRNHARGVFAEAGIEVVWDTKRGIYVLADPAANQEAQGRKLVEIIKREFGKPRTEADPLYAVLVNSVRSQDGGMWVSSAFSPQLRNELFSVAQGEASFYGLMLGALASAKRTLSWVATHVDTVLHKAYSEAFGGKDIGTILTKVADEIEKQTGVDPRDQKAVAKEKDKVAKAKKRALDSIKKVLTVQQKRLVDKPIKGKKSLWMRIEEAVDAGVFDNASILQEIARANGWEVPTPVQLQRLKDMAERERSLRDTPEKAAATKEERYRLMREMQTLWSRFSRPITWRTPEGRRNFGAAGAEYLSANMLLKAGFWVKQPIDVSSQVFWHVPTRALASAAQIARQDREAGRPTRFWQDAGSALADASKNLVTSANESVVQFRQGLRGRGELRNVEGIVGTINAFDRLRQRADELAARGDHGRATVLRLVSWIQFSFRLARALDNAQGAFIVGQETRERIIEELRSAGRNPAQAAQEADTIIGDRTAEVALAMGRAKEILDAEGIEHNQTQLAAAAFELYRARQFERIKAAGLDADNIAGSNERLRQTVGWNMPERRGIGGAIGGSVRNIGRAIEEVGIPLPIGRFGNAIAIGINRALTWTPAGFFPSLFGGSENAWFRTPKDWTQRKMEAATGSAMGGVFIGMALLGLIRVWNKGPDDPEERELWEKEGHRPGTVEFYVGDQVITLSMSTGPISYMRGVLGGIGTMQDVIDGHAKRARRLSKEAAKRDLKAPPQEGVDANDLMGALAFGGYQAILGGRTAGGAIRSTIGQPESVSDFLRSFAASQTSPFVPLLPALQEAQRARGVRMRYNMADFSDLLLPTHDANGARRNFLNDPMIPSLQQSVVQTLTGGTYGPFEPGKDATKPYRIFGRIEYRPDTISRTQGFAIGDTFRPLSDEEWKKAMALRGDRLKAELENVSEYQTDEDLEEEVKAIAPAVRLEALEAVGVR